MTPALTDPFCQCLHTDMSTLEADLSRALPFTQRAERDTLLKLVAGLTVVFQFASGKTPPTAELNAVGSSLLQGICVTLLSNGICSCRPRYIW